MKDVLLGLILKRVAIVGDLAVSVPRVPVTLHDLLDDDGSEIPDPAEPASRLWIKSPFHRQGGRYTRAI
jgi:hypothetical protein